MHLKLDKYHIAAIGFLVIFLASIFTIFSYRIRTLPSALPPVIISEIKQETYKGIPVFTTTQFFDHLIHSYPTIDLRAAGNKPWEQTETLHSFLLLSLDNNIQNFLHSSQILSKKLQEEDGIFLYLLTQKSGKQTILLSSMVDALQVSSSYYPKGSTFKLGIHKTGYKSWMYVGLLTEKFNKKMREGIWSHPLDKKGTFITIKTPALSHAATAVFQSGITDTGKCHHCSPVIATITQGELTQKITAPEGAWNEIPLKKFDAKKPFTIKITTTKPGRRHYCFNIAYTMENNE